MAKKNKKDDQDFSEINLLPEDLRSAEKKARQAASSKEELYQLRAPKKIKRRKRFGFVPFFGGPHWEIKSAAEKKKEEEEKKREKEQRDPSAVIRQTGEAPSGRSQPIRVPQQSSAPQTIQVLPSSPGVPKVSRKKPVSFFSRLFGGGRSKKPSAPRPAPRPISTFQAPARHYSLLDESVLSDSNKERESKGPEPEFKPAAQQGEVPMTSTTGGMAAMPDRGMDYKASGERVKGQRSFKWFDIFGLFKWLTTPSGTKQRKEKKPKAPEPDIRVVRHHMQGGVESQMNEAGVKTEETTGSTVIPTVPEASRSAPTITPVLEKEAKQKHHRERKPFRLPAWLDLFGVFGALFKNSKRKPRKAKVTQLTPEPMHVEQKGNEKMDEPVTPITEKTEEPKTVIPSQPAPSPTITPVTAPQAEQKKAKKEKKPFKLPAWLDLFGFFGRLFKKHPKKPKKHLKEEKKVEVPLPPVPEPTRNESSGVTPQVTQPEAKDPSELITPVSEKMEEKVEDGHKPEPQTEGVTPATMESKMEDTGGMPITPVPTPEKQPSMDGVMPPTPEHRPDQPVTPKPFIPKEDHEITSIPPEEDAGKKHEMKSKDQTKGGFHLPGKGVFGNAPDASMVNLIPSRYSVIRSWKQIGRAVGIAAGSAFAICAIVYAGLSVWQTQIEQRTTELDTEIQKFREQLRVYEDVSEPQMTALGNEIALVTALLERHIYWTDFFQLLEKYTLPDVYFDGISASTNGTLSLTAHGSSFETISRQLLLLQSEDAQEFVVDVQINGGQISGVEDGQTEVTFVILLTLNPNLFYYGDSE